MGDGLLPYVIQRGFWRSHVELHMKHVLRTFYRLTSEKNSNNVKLKRRSSFSGQFYPTAWLSHIFVVSYWRSPGDELLCGYRQYWFTFLDLFFMMKSGQRTIRWLNPQCTTSYCETVNKLFEVFDMSRFKNFLANLWEAYSKSPLLPPLLSAVVSTTYLAMFVKSLNG